MAITINGTANTIGGLTPGGLPDGSIVADDFASGALDGAGGGKILQVVQTVKTDTTSQSSSSNFQDISGISVSITPSSSSNKVLVFADLALGSQDLSSHHLIWRLVRDSTAIGVSTSATSVDLTGTGGMHRGTTGGNSYYFGTSKMFLDSPSTTSSTTYKVQWSANDSGATLYLNKRGDDAAPGAISTITVMEVAA